VHARERRRPSRDHFSLLEDAHLPSKREESSLRSLTPSFPHLPARQVHVRARGVFSLSDRVALEFSSIYAIYRIVS